MIQPCEEIASLQDCRSAAFAIGHGVNAPFLRDDLSGCSPDLRLALGPRNCRSRTCHLSSAATTPVLGAGVWETLIFRCNSGFN